VGGGGESVVVVPAAPSAALEVVEAGIQFPVVVVEAPADFRYSDKFFQRGCLRPQVSWGDHSKYIYQDGLLTVNNNLSV